MTSQSDDRPEPDARQIQDELMRDALAAGRSYEVAGELVGVSARTVRRRMSDPEFRSSVLAQMAEVNTQLSSLISTESIAAVEILVELTRDPDPRIRLRAIQLLLSNGIRTRREVELNERITALEERLFIASADEGQTS